MDYRDQLKQLDSVVALDKSIDKVVKCYVEKTYVPTSAITGSFTGETIQTTMPIRTGRNLLAPGRRILTLNK